MVRMLGMQIRRCLENWRTFKKFVSIGFNLIDLFRNTEQVHKASSGIPYPAESNLHVCGYYFEQIHLQLK